MRITSSLWVDSLVRRCNALAVPVYVARRGAAEAGAIFVKVEHADRRIDLYGPAPQAMVADPGSSERRFELVLSQVDALEAADYLAAQIRFDTDLWVLDIDHRPDWPVDHLGMPPA
ncbi:MAG: DUF1491 family protein [Pseudomonadota bacterium]